MNSSWDEFVKVCLTKDFEKDNCNVSKDLKFLMKKYATEYIAYLVSSAYAWKEAGNKIDDDFAKMNGCSFDFLQKILKKHYDRVLAV